MSIYIIYLPMVIQHIFICIEANIQLPFKLECLYEKYKTRLLFVTFTVKTCWSYEIIAFGEGVKVAVKFKLTDLNFYWIFLFRKQYTSYMRRWGSLLERYLTDSFVSEMVKRFAFALWTSLIMSYALRSIAWGYWIADYCSCRVTARSEACALKSLLE